MWETDWHHADWTFLTQPLYFDSALLSHFFSFCVQFPKASAAWTVRLTDVDVAACIFCMLFRL